MNATDSSQALPRLESVTRLGIVALGVLYVCGFAVVFFSLSPYGVSFSISLLRAQYIIVGVLALGPILLTAFFFSALWPRESVVVPTERSSGTWATLKSIGKFSWYLLCAVVLTDFFLKVFASPFVPKGNSDSLLWSNVRLFVRMGTFCTVLAWIFFVTWLWIRKWMAEASWTPRKLVDAFFRIVLCVTLSFLYLAFFSESIYPRIPHSAGGGMPLNVSFILKPVPNSGSIVIPDNTGNRLCRTNSCWRPISIYRDIARSKGASNGI